MIVSFQYTIVDRRRTYLLLLIVIGSSTLSTPCAEAESGDDRRFYGILAAYRHSFYADTLYTDT